MTPEERALIDGLFERMRDVANQPRDPQAEALIARRLAEMPYAPYAFAQTILVQEHALQQAAARIEELEDEAMRRQAEPPPAPAGGFLGGLFGGGGRGSVPSAGARAAPMGTPQGWNRPGQGGPAYAQQGGPGGPWGGQQQPMPQRGGGGFLQGALATAAGVAGGALLFEGIKNMMGSGDSPVAQQAAAELGKPAEDAAGSLGGDAQAALGGAPQEENFWNADSSHQEASYDDGGDWGGDDNSWA